MLSESYLKYVAAVDEVENMAVYCDDIRPSDYGDLLKVTTLLKTWLRDLEEHSIIDFRDAPV